MYDEYSYIANHPNDNFIDILLEENQLKIIFEDSFYVYEYSDFYYYDEDMRDFTIKETIDFMQSECKSIVYKIVDYIGKNINNLQE